MVAQVFGVFSSPAQAESAIVRIKNAGIRASGITVLPVNAEENLDLSIKRGVIGGAILGAGMGLALVFYSDSTIFNNWGGAISMPISAAFGWALYGWILGGTGLLAGSASKANAMLSLRLPVLNQLEEAENVLYEAGASEVGSTGPVAA